MYTLLVLAITTAAVEAKPSGVVWYQKEEHLLAAKEASSISASFHARLFSLQVRRYVYDTTGQWLDLHDQTTDLADLLEVQDNAVVLHERDSALIERHAHAQQKDVHVIYNMI